MVDENAGIYFGDDDRKLESSERMKDEGIHTPLLS